MRSLKCSFRTLFVSAIAVTLSFSVATPAQADNPAGGVNYNRTNWTVLHKFTGRAKDILPLREGQCDYHAPGMPVVNGWGACHIRNAHGRVPSYELIQEAFLIGKCTAQTWIGKGRYICKTDEVEVAFQNQVDPRSPDRYAFGIISAWYPAPPANECTC